jgi:hypothetical protein
MQQRRSDSCPQSAPISKQQARQTLVSSSPCTSTTYCFCCCNVRALPPQVKEAFLELRVGGNDATEQEVQGANEDLRRVLSNMKAVGEPRLLKQQRRGERHGAKLYV